MATVQLSNRLGLRELLRKAAPEFGPGSVQALLLGQVPAQLRKAAERGPGAPGASPSVLETLAFAGRRLLGVVFLLLGILMMFSLVLLPIGLPLALFAVALIAAPDSFARSRPRAP